MHVHLIGVAGTGMGALAGLLKAAGHRVSGSDTAFHPPMGEALARWGIETKTGYAAANLEPRPDLVIVGNVCRKDNVEARAAIDGGLAYDSMPGAIEKLFLADRPGWVVAGTHGKTTTTALLAYLAHRAGLDPGLLVGGIPKDFGESFRVGAASAPFVIEGDEYDSAFFEKSPKFLRYRPRAVILTSIEHDHIDIYPDEASYLAAFEALIAKIPADGVLVAWAGDAHIRRLVKQAVCRVVFFALSTDDVGDVSPVWVAAPIAAQGGAQPFDLFVGGSSGGPVLSPLMGEHNVRNALAAIALVSEATDGSIPVPTVVLAEQARTGVPAAGTDGSDRPGSRIPVQTLTQALRSFSGVKRRQDLLAEADGVFVYDDFAHHPTAVRETLAGIRSRHPDVQLFAVFEPRSATACRKIHEKEYEEAFHHADVALLAPLGRTNIPESERLSVEAIAASIRARGGDAMAPPDHDAIVKVIVERAKRGDAVLLMSNGDMGGLHDRVIAALAMR